ncbi:MAG: hypothetical protein INF43_02585 [Alphaproteobacteria bacterium]|jgi:hypothetical protein|nr:hypothetical protein [Alphaproteobacteria bacterium]
MFTHDPRMEVVAALNAAFPTGNADEMPYREAFSALCEQHGGESVPGFPKLGSQSLDGPTHRLDIYDFGEQGQLALLADHQADRQMVVFDEVWPAWLHQLVEQKSARKMN